MCAEFKFPASIISLVISIRSYDSVCKFSGVVRKCMKLGYHTFKVTKLISQQITRSLVSFGIPSYYCWLRYFILGKILILL